MRKLVSLCLGIYFIPVTGHSQTNTTQLPNGVIVHQAVGVEGTPQKKSETSQVRTMEDWTLAECLDMRPILELKLSEANTEEDKQRYANQKVALDKRISELKSGN